MRNLYALWVEVADLRVEETFQKTMIVMESLV